MFKCLFCGFESFSDKAQFCGECGPDSPAKNWRAEEIDISAQVEQYAVILIEFFFEAEINSEIDIFSRRRREKLRISYATHLSIISKLEELKKTITPLSQFRLEFNSNISDAYAGHDSFLEFPNYCDELILCHGKEGIEQKQLNELSIWLLN